MTPPKRVQAFRLHLDPRLPLEALLLNRLHGLPRGRREEWLRTLVIQGFRVECQALKALVAPMPETAAAPVAASRPLTQTLAAAPCEPAIEATPEPPAPATGAAAKPFAALHNVIG